MMSNPLTTETLEELERLYGRLQAITDHPLEVDQDADEPAIIYVHSRGEKCADGRHHTYMVGLAHMSEDWKDDGRPLADAVVAIINAFPALLAAARERETLRTLEAERDGLLDIIYEVDDAIEKLPDRGAWEVTSDDGAQSRPPERHELIAGLIEASGERDTLRQQLATLTAERDEARTRVSALEGALRGMVEECQSRCHGCCILCREARALLTPTPETP